MVLNYLTEAADALNFTLRARCLSACFFGRVTTGPTAALHNNTENAAPNFIRIHLPADDNLVDKMETICCRCCEIKSSRSSSSLVVLFHIGAQRRAQGCFAVDSYTKGVFLKPC